MTDDSVSLIHRSRMAHATWLASSLLASLAALAGAHRQDRIPAAPLEVITPDGPVLGIELNNTRVWRKAELRASQHLHLCVAAPLPV